MGRAGHENQERWSARQSMPTTLDIPIPCELAKIPLAGATALDASPRAVATSSWCGPNRETQPHPSVLISSDDHVDQLLTTYEGTLLCAS